MNYSIANIQSTVKHCILIAFICGLTNNSYGQDSLTQINLVGGIWNVCLSQDSLSECLCENPISKEEYFIDGTYKVHAESLREGKTVNHLTGKWNLVGDILTTKIDDLYIDSEKKHLATYSTAKLPITNVSENCFQVTTMTGNPDLPVIYLYYSRP